MPSTSTVNTASASISHSVPDQLFNGDDTAQCKPRVRVSVTRCKLPKNVRQATKLGPCTEQTQTHPSTLGSDSATFDPQNSQYFRMEILPVFALGTLTPREPVVLLGSLAGLSIDASRLLRLRSRRAANHTSGRPLVQHGSESKARLVCLFRL
jgi:hypothetical protein